MTLLSLGADRGVDGGVGERDADERSALVSRVVGGVAVERVGELVGDLTLAGDAQHRGLERERAGRGCVDESAGHAPVVERGPFEPRAVASDESLAIVDELAEALDEGGHAVAHRRRELLANLDALDVADELLAALGQGGEGVRLAGGDEVGMAKMGGSTLSTRTPR